VRVVPGIIVKGGVDEDDDEGDDQEEEVVGESMGAMFARMGDDAKGDGSK